MQIRKLVGRIFKSRTSRPGAVAGRVLLGRRIWVSSWASITR